jgi:hypothetical protein
MSRNGSVLLPAFLATPHNSHQFLLGTQPLGRSLHTCIRLQSRSRVADGHATEKTFRFAGICRYVGQIAEWKKDADLRIHTELHLVQTIFINGPQKP